MYMYSFSMGTVTSKRTFQQVLPLELLKEKKKRLQGAKLSLEQRIVQGIMCELLFLKPRFFLGFFWFDPLLCWYFR